VGPLKDVAGKDHNISVRMDVSAIDNELQFTLHLSNGTDKKIKDVAYPMIGGLGHFKSPDKPADGTLWVPTGLPWIKKLDEQFGSAHFGYPGGIEMPFTCLQSAAAGKSLYFASLEKLARYRVYQFDERGSGDAKDTMASIRHIPYTQPGKTFDGSAVVLRVIDGDWRAAGKIYHDWFDKTFGICKASQCWIRRESFFQMTMFELPEGTVNYRFQDIPQWAKDAKGHGINSLMISGWNRGGHDNGYPYYTVDPRLGTWEELEAGVKACHEMGMRVYFFVNYQPVMIDSDWYKNELHRYVACDQNGPIGPVGWGMGTLWARMNHPKLMTVASPAFPQYRKILVDYFTKLAQIGADGIHVDKMGPIPLEFNPDVPMSPDTASWEGAMMLTQEIFDSCRRYNPDWAISFEGGWDRLLQFTPATWWVGYNPILRFVFPEHAETLLIAQAYDRVGVNSAVRNRQIVMVGPMNMCRSVGWKPWQGLADYIKEVKRIQDSLTDTAFLGEVIGHQGVVLPNIQADEDLPKPAVFAWHGMQKPPLGIEYNVMRNFTTGKRVCIFTNASSEATKQTVQAFEGNPAGEARVHAPFADVKTVILPADIEVPAEGIVFLEEK
jgi:hypothetical protein